MLPSHSRYASAELRAVNASPQGSGAWVLMVLWSGFLFLSAWVWSIWGRDGFPVGTAWWDELALEGAAHAVQQGMVPAVDFWAPFILPIYLKALAQSLAGLSGGYVLECLMQGAVVLLLLTALLGLGRHSVWVYLLGAWAVLQVLLPFNFGSLVQAPPGAVSFAGAYNRLGGALVSLVILHGISDQGDGVSDRGGHLRGARGAVWQWGVSLVVVSACWAGCRAVVRVFDRKWHGARISGCAGGLGEAALELVA